MNNKQLSIKIIFFHHDTKENTEKSFQLCFTINYLKNFLRLLCPYLIIIF